MAPSVGRNPVVDGRDPVAGDRPPPWTKMRWRGGLHPETVLPRDVNAQRRARAGLRREIDSQAGWIGRRPVVGMARPVIAIRWSTDETPWPRPATPLNENVVGPTSNATRS